jgi:hypothetical protein
MYIKIEFDNKVLGLLKKRLFLIKGMLLIKKGCFLIIK